MSFHQTATIAYTAVGGGSLDVDASQTSSAVAGDAFDIDGIILSRT